MNDRNLAIQISKHPLIKKLLETKLATTSEVARLIVMEMRKSTPDEKQSKIFDNLINNLNDSSNWDGVLQSYKTFYAFTERNKNITDLNINGLLGPMSDSFTAAQDEILNGATSVVINDSIEDYTKFVDTPVAKSSLQSALNGVLSRYKMRTDVSLKRIKNQMKKLQAIDSPGTFQYVDNQEAANKKIIDDLNKYRDNVEPIISTLLARHNTKKIQLDREDLEDLETIKANAEQLQGYLEKTGAINTRTSGDADLSSLNNDQKTVVANVKQELEDKENVKSKDVQQAIKNAQKQTNVELNPNEEEEVMTSLKDIFAGLDQDEPELSNIKSKYETDLQFLKDEEKKVIYYLILGLKKGGLIKESKFKQMGKLGDLLKDTVPDDQIEKLKSAIGDHVPPQLWPKIIEILENEENRKKLLPILSKAFEDTIVSADQLFDDELMIDDESFAAGENQDEKEVVDQIVKSVETNVDSNATEDDINRMTQQETEKLLSNADGETQNKIAQAAATQLKQEPGGDDQSKTTTLVDPEQVEKSPEISEEFINNANSFTREFYRQRYKKDQGEIIKNIVKSLKDLVGDNLEAAFSRVPEEPEETKLQESEEEVLADKQDLSNIRLAFNTFLKKVNKARKYLDAFKKVAKEGSIVANSYKKRFIETLEEIQKSVKNLVVSVGNIIGEEKLQENTSEVRKEMAEVQKLYDIAQESVSNIKELLSGDKINKIPDEDIRTALSSLTKLARYFPNVAPFGARDEKDPDYEEYDIRFTNATEDVKDSLQNVLKLLKRGEGDRVVLNDARNGIKIFSTEIQSIFGVDSEFEDAKFEDNEEAVEEEPVSPQETDDDDEDEDYELDDLSFLDYPSADDYTEEELAQEETEVEEETEEALEPAEQETVNSAERTLKKYFEFIKNLIEGEGSGALRESLKTKIARARGGEASKKQFFDSLADFIRKRTKDRGQSVVAAANRLVKKVGDPKSETSFPERDVRRALRYLWNKTEDWATEDEKNDFWDGYEITTELNLKVFKTEVTGSTIQKFYREILQSSFEGSSDDSKEQLDSDYINRILKSFIIAVKTQVASGEKPNLFEGKSIREFRRLTAGGAKKEFFKKLHAYLTKNLQKYPDIFESEENLKTFFNEEKDTDDWADKQEKADLLAAYKTGFFSDPKLSGEQIKDTVNAALEEEVIQNLNQDQIINKIFDLLNQDMKKMWEDGEIQHYRYLFTDPTEQTVYKKWSGSLKDEDNDTINQEENDKFNVVGDIQEIYLIIERDTSDDDGGRKWEREVDTEYKNNKAGLVEAYNDIQEYIKKAKKEQDKKKEREAIKPLINFMKNEFAGRNDMVYLFASPGYDDNQINYKNASQQTQLTEKELEGLMSNSARDHYTQDSFRSKYVFDILKFEKKDGGFKATSIDAFKRSAATADKIGDLEKEVRSAIQEFLKKEQEESGSVEEKIARKLKPLIRELMYKGR